MPEDLPTAPGDRAGLSDPADLGIVDSLVQLSFLIQSILTRAGAAHDLSLTQLRLVGIVRDRDAGMLELAGHLGLDKSSVTGLIDRAEKRSLVRRSRAPQDGRALRVSITATGLELAHIVEAAVRDEIAMLTGVLTARQQAQLSGLASTVVGGLSAGRARPSPRNGPRPRSAAAAGSAPGSRPRR